MLELHITELGRDRNGPYQNLRLNLAETAARQSILRSRPVHLQIETTTKCNLGCIQCGLHSYALKNQDFDLDALERLGTELFGTVGSVIFSDTGEALMYGGIEQVFDLIRRYRIPIGGFFTNGTYLDEKAVDRIVRSGVAFVNVSIDGGTKETYETVRLGANFEEVIAGLARLCAKRGELGTRYPVVQVNCVGMTENLEEFPELVRICAEAKADRVICSNLVPYTFELQSHSLVHAQDRTFKVREEALRLGEELGIYVGFPEPSLPAMLHKTAELGSEVFDRPVSSLAPLASVQAIDVPETVSMSEFLQFQVDVRNLSTTRFRTQGEPVIGQVWLSYHWMDESGEVVVFDGLRSPLGLDLEPGGVRRVLCTVRTPEKPGKYRLALDLVREGVRWFEDLCTRTDLTFQVRDQYALSYFPAPLGPCDYPWRYMSIKVSGDVYPCCWLSKSLGNVLEQSVEDIWNGERYQKLRDSITDGSYSVCRGAHCPYASLTPTNTFRANLEALEAPTSVTLGDRFHLPVRLTNHSPYPFVAKGDDFDNVVWVAYHWISERGATLVFDGLRTPLKADLASGESVDLVMEIATPPRPGRHRILLDLVIEGATWFSQAGNPPTELSIEVVRSAAASAPRSQT